jgi:hypothetical protein
MNDLYIKTTQSTPSIKAEVATGQVVLRGDSYPENTFEFFAPLNKWILAYLDNSQAPLHLELHLLYLNTSSVKVMMDIFDALEEAHEAGRTVSVMWYYDADNERIAELAAEFKEDCTFPFDIILQS